MMYMRYTTLTFIESAKRQQEPQALTTSQHILYEASYSKLDGIIVILLHHNHKMHRTKVYKKCVTKRKRINNDK